MARFPSGSGPAPLELPFEFLALRLLILVDSPVKLPCTRRNDVYPNVTARKSGVAFVRSFVISLHTTMKFFLAGIMQGSHLGAVLHHQGYRERLKAMIAEHFPDAEIYDPLADHQDSIEYDEATGREVFYRHNRMCREVDVVVAFIPEASMGTAIEMWEAHEHGRGVVISISPLEHNWAVRFCSHEIFPDIDAFEAAIVSGKLQRRITELLGGDVE